MPQNPQQLLDQLGDYIRDNAASKPTAPGTFGERAAAFGRRASASAGKGVLGAIEGAPKAAIGALGTAAGVALLSKFRKKPSLLKSIFSSGGPLTTALAYGAGATAIGGGVWAAGKGLEAATDPYKKERAFKALKSESPALVSGDPVHARKSFETLWRFNPDMAKDPLVASSFVRKAIAFKEEGVQSQDIKTLADVRKAMSDAKKNKSKPFAGVLPETAGDQMRFEPKE
ncbi:MAG: hypothetical protein ACOYOB_19175 [Myxococcota bacterium]